jgi:ABC-type antimicrobial peptide transport system permease subunit
MVLRQGLTLVAAGLTVGLAASLALTRTLQGFLFNTGPSDPLALAIVAAALAVAGMLACLGPAWRATGVDPMLALRGD